MQKKKRNTWPFVALKSREAQCRRCVRLEFNRRDLVALVYSIHVRNMTHGKKVKNKERATNTEPSRKQGVVSSPVATHGVAEFFMCRGWSPARLPSVATSFKPPSTCYARPRATRSRALKMERTPARAARHAAPTTADCLSTRVFPLLLHVPLPTHPRTPFLLFAPCIPTDDISHPSLLLAPPGALAAPTPNPLHTYHAHRLLPSPCALPPASPSVGCVVRIPHCRSPLESCCRRKVALLCLALLSHVAPLPLYLSLSLHTRPPRGCVSAWVPSCAGPRATVTCSRRRHLFVVSDSVREGLLSL